jgi:hypothetical protein
MNATIWSRFAVISRSPKGVCMTEDIKARGLSFAKFLSGVSPAERGRVNEKSRQEALAQHKLFKEKFRAGQCCFCGDALTAFDAAKPCRHWLLKPVGFGKEHFGLLAKEHSWTVLENYLGWVANEGAFAQNINDLADEGTGKLVESTIKYETIAWSFSCGAGDLAGHEGGAEASKRPHYHFQMYVDEKPFIRFNDFHLPLSETDIGFLECMRSNPGKVRKRLAGGEGMSEVLDESMLEHVVRLGRSGTTEDEAENAPIKLDTFIMAEPGRTIKGEDIYNLIQAAKAEGVTLSSKVRELRDVSVHTIVSPGPGVVEQAPRKGRKKGANQQLRAQDREWRERQKREL